MRFALMLLSLLLLVAGFVASPFTATAADHPDSHPMIGSWSVDAVPGDTEFSPRLMVFSADGTSILVSGHQVTGVGHWEIDQDNSALITFYVVSDGSAYLIIRAKITVTADKQSFTGTFTNEFLFDPAGDGTSGEIGPGTLSGTRIKVEAPGTPAMSFEEMFPHPVASPNATPGA